MSTSIGVIGTGYVGLVTGVCLAETGNSVLCIDVDAEKVERMRAGDVPIYEPGLDVLLKRNLREQRLRFSLDLEEAVRTCQVLMLCLPTPPDEDGSADLKYVLAACRSIAAHIDALNITEPRVVVNKSTVPVGTAELVTEIFREAIPERDVTVVSNPEFLREGFAVEDFMKPDRVIVGTSNEYAREVMLDLYEPFVRSGNPIHIFDERTAEVVKYAANSFLATKISFMNDLSEYCEKVGADIESVRTGIGSDERIGKRFLFAGIGYGGSCFPKDVKALTHAARAAGTPLDILEAVQRVNDRQVRRFVERIRQRFDGWIEGRVFGLWGLAFKPNTDDVREAPAFVIVNELVKYGATVRAYDPVAHGTASAILGDKVTYATSMYDAISGVDALIVATEWSEFRKPDWNRVKSAMLRPLVFDGRNIWDPADVGAEGIEYHSVGRASALPPSEE